MASPRQGVVLRRVQGVRRRREQWRTWLDWRRWAGGGGAGRTGRAGSGRAGRGGREGRGDVQVSGGSAGNVGNVSEKLQTFRNTHETEGLGDSLSLPDSICQVTTVYQVMTRTQNVINSNVYY